VNHSNKSLEAELDEWVTYIDWNESSSINFLFADPGPALDQALGRLTGALGAPHILNPADRESIETIAETLTASSFEDAPFIWLNLTWRPMTRRFTKRVRSSWPGSMSAGIRSESW